MDMSYLMLRRDVWWYNRRIPSKYTHLDTRGRIRKSLDTYAKEEACLLRDKLVEADNQYWAALALDALGDGEGQAGAQARCAAAVARAEAAGFSYRPFLEIALDEQIYKSTAQKASWRKVKLLAVRYFTDQFGDLPIDDITREHALA